MLSSLSIHGIPGTTEARYDIGRETAIIGANGSGKTHILEAIHRASGGSLSTPWGEDMDSSIEMIVSTEHGPKSYSLTRLGGRDIYSLQGRKITGVKYRENLPFRTVFISPFDMNLLYFAPSMRRDYIDSILARTFAQFSRVRRDYTELVRQRNALLKKIREGETEKRNLDAWDAMLIEKMVIYEAYRSKWRAWIESHMGEIETFLPRYHVSLQYESSMEEK